MPKQRCDWGETSPLMQKYHDKEWGNPTHNDKKLFEAFLLDMFQAGLSWATILNKRTNFKKAFDSIPRHKLFQKLLDHNINGKFYDILVNMYTNDVACIKISDTITPSFIANQGVKQGCILSPTLFNIFLSDIQAVTDTAACDPVQIREGLNLSCIIWEDDILLLSKSEAGLGNMLSALKTYTEENGMTINTKKHKQ